MSIEAAREALFGDALACEGARPLAVLPALSAPRRHAVLLRGEALLRALALLDDARAEDAEDPGDPAVHRIEAKIDLLVGLVGALLQRDQPLDPVCPLQWSARGAAVDLPSDAVAPTAGSAAMLRVQPSDALPEALQLPAQVLAVEPLAAGSRVWLRFDPLPPSMEALLERHLFRLHRRAVAERRRQR